MIDGDEMNYNFVVFVNEKNEMKNDFDDYYDDYYDG